MIPITFLISAFLIFSPVDSKCIHGDSLFESRCFQFNNIYLSYSDADQYCKSQGFFLSSIQNVIENRFLTATARNKFSISYGKFWIGLQRNASSFYWENGQSYSYTNWYNGNPLEGYLNVGCDIADGKWISSLPTSQYQFVCSYLNHDEFSTSQTDSTTFLESTVSDIL